MTTGTQWCVENNFGVKKDREATEEKGYMKNADPDRVSDLAKKRGLKQLGTLGAGNHFIELQKAETI